jgi:hypothetical protein
MNEPSGYIERRLDPQVRWHDQRAKLNKRLFYTVEVATIMAGAAVPVVNLWANRNAWLAGVLSAIFGGVVVVAAAVGKLFKFHDNWLHYRALVESLSREKELYSAGAGDYASADAAGRSRLLVERTEALLANKTTQFLQTHKENGISIGDNL